MWEDFIYVTHSILVVQLLLWWDETLSLWNWAANVPIAHHSDDTWVNIEQQWNDIDRGNWRTWRKICPNATLSTKNSKWTVLGTNLGIRGDRPVTNYLSSACWFYHIDNFALSLIHLLFMQGGRTKNCEKPSVCSWSQGDVYRLNPERPGDDVSMHAMHKHMNWGKALSARLYVLSPELHSRFKFSFLLEYMPEVAMWLTFFSISVHNKSSSIWIWNLTLEFI
jgi:hypothetical protein